MMPNTLRYEAKDQAKHHPYKHRSLSSIFRMVVGGMIPACTAEGSKNSPPLYGLSLPPYPPDSTLNTIYVVKQ